MLAATVDTQTLEKLRYPLLASPKLDGIRCIIHPTLGAVSRSFKPIPNQHVRLSLNYEHFVGLDGELMVVDGQGQPLDFNPIQSAIMTQSGAPTFEFWVFDYLLTSPEREYRFRYDALLQNFLDPPGYGFKRIKPLIHVRINNAEEAREFAASCIAKGYEGMVLRDPTQPYKSGRSTLKQQGMIKYKEFFDAEGIVVGFEELVRNKNEQTKDAFGLAERSDKKEGMVFGNTLGALILKTVWGDVRVGSGFDAALRDEIWANKDKYLNKLVTFKYQRFGMKDLPRIPIFLRFREEE
jgi:DNA ligase-1